MTILSANTQDTVQYWTTAAAWWREEARRQGGRGFYASASMAREQAIMCDERAKLLS